MSLESNQYVRANIVPCGGMDWNSILVFLHPRAVRLDGREHVMLMAADALFRLRTPPTMIGRSRGCFLGPLQRPFFFVLHLFPLARLGPSEQRSRLWS